MPKNNEYQELNYSSFEHIVKSHCSGTVLIKNNSGAEVWREISSQYLDGNILLISGLDKVERDRFQYGDGVNSTGVNKDMLAKFRNGSKELSAWIITAYMTKEDIVDIVTEEFEQNLLCFFHGNSADLLLDDLMAVIKKDTKIPQNYKGKFVSLHADYDVSRFLAETFVYSIIRNKLALNKLKLNTVLEHTMGQLIYYNKTDFLPALIDSMADYLKYGIAEDEPEWYSYDDYYTLFGTVIPRLKQLRDSTALDSEHLFTFDYIRCFFMTSDMSRAKTMDELNTIIQKYGFTKDDYALLSGGPIGGSAEIGSAEFSFMFHDVPTTIKMTKTENGIYDVHMEQTPEP